MNRIREKILKNLKADPYEVPLLEIEEDEL